MTWLRRGRPARDKFADEHHDGRISWQPTYDGRPDAAVVDSVWRSRKRSQDLKNFYRTKRFREKMMFYRHRD